MFRDKPKLIQIALAGIAALGLVGLTVLLVGQANALEIQNDDEKDYRVQIFEGLSSKTIEVAASSIATDLCHERCRVVVDGVGSIDAETGDVIRIEQGKLVSEPN